MGDLFEPEHRYTFPAPRECQVRALDGLRAGLRAGHRNQLLVLPTGSGKTVAALMLIAECLKKSKRAVFVCDRVTLINQASENADRYGLHQHGVVQADHWRRNNSLPFQIASIQTVQARGYWPESDLVVIDEAHVLHAAHKELLESKRVPVIGLTATPCTKGLGKYFSHVVNAATMHELTQAQVLVPLRILSCQAPDMRGAETSGGEWTHRAASEREAKIIGDVVGEWIAHAEGRKTIAFGADISYCNQLVQRFNGAGVNAAAYTSETSDAECAELLQEFRKPDSRVRVLVSVEKLAKGFDVPDVSCVIDARPLRKSLSTAIQMWGRGLRSAPGKSECLLLDFTRNIVRFMPEFEDVFFNGFRSLDESEKLDSKPREDDADIAGGCPQCGHKPFSRRCLACGFEKPSQALEDTSVGHMREIRIGKVVAATSDQHMWEQLCTYARQTSERAPGRAWHLYRDIVGKRPDGLTRFEDTPDVPIHPATIRKIKSLRIAWIKGRNTAPRAAP